MCIRDRYQYYDHCLSFLNLIICAGSFGILTVVHGLSQQYVETGYRSADYRYHAEVYKIYAGAYGGGDT